MFVCTGRWELLTRMLATTRGWYSLYPISAMRAQHYQQLLAQRIQEVDEDVESEATEATEDGDDDDDEGRETELPVWWSHQVVGPSSPEIG